MSKEELKPEELENAEAEQLPDREAMSIIPLPADPGFATLPVEPPTGHTPTDV